MPAPAAAVAASPAAGRCAGRPGPAPRPRAAGASAPQPQPAVRGPGACAATRRDAPPPDRVCPRPSRRAALELLLGGALALAIAPGGAASAAADLADTPRDSDLLAAAAARLLPEASSAQAARSAAEEVSFRALEQEAKAAYEGRRLGEALDRLTELWARDPENPVWPERRGQVQVDLKRFDAALQDFAAATARQPPNYRSLGLLSNRALAHEGRGDFASAAADYEEAIGLAALLGASAPYLLNGRANCAAALGEYEEALAGYRESARAFQGARNLGGALLADSNAALMLAQLGRDAEAVRALEAVARRGPGSFDARAALAAEYFAMGDVRRAEEQWEWATVRLNDGQVSGPGGPVLDGAARYRDAGWLQRVRRWPPVMCQRLRSFLSLAPTPRAGAGA